MNYINTDKRNRISTRCTKTITKSSTSLSNIHKKLVDTQTDKWTRPPQMSTEKTKVALQAFNHHNEYDFTLSNNCGIGFCWFLNNLLFSSFRKIQTHNSHIFIVIYPSSVHCVCLHIRVRHMKYLLT